MGVHRKTDWKEEFFKPLDFSADFDYTGMSEKDIRDYHPGSKKCYPTIFDYIPARERQELGFFFDDEVNVNNMEQVRYLRMRSVGDMVPDYPGADDLSAEADVFKVEQIASLPNLEVLVGDIESVGFSGSLPSLQKVVGEIFVYFGQVELPRLETVTGLNGGRIVCERNSDVRADSLQNIHCIKCTDSSFKSSSLENLPYLDIRNGSASFPGLVDCGDVRTYQCRSLEAPSLLHVSGSVLVDGDGHFDFPELQKVDSYLTISGKAELSAPELFYVGGLVNKSEGKVSLNSLFNVGKTFYRAEFGDYRSFGDVELKEGTNTLAPRLSTINGSFECCHSARFLLPQLDTVKGDMHVNCGRWIYFQAGKGYRREDVAGDKPQVYSFPSLVSVKGSLEVFDNTELKVPNLGRVGGTLSFGKDCSFAHKTVVSAGQFDSFSRGLGKNVVVKGQMMSL